MAVELFWVCSKKPWENKLNRDTRLWPTRTLVPPCGAAYKGVAESPSLWCSWAPSHPATSQDSLGTWVHEQCSASRETLQIPVSEWWLANHFQRDPLIISLTGSWIQECKSAQGTDQLRESILRIPLFWNQWKMRSHQIMVEKIKGDFHSNMLLWHKNRWADLLEEKRKGIKELRSGNTCTKMKLTAPCRKPLMPAWWLLKIWQSYEDQDAVSLLRKDLSACLSEHQDRLRNRILKSGRTLTLSLINFKALGSQCLLFWYYSACNKNAGTLLLFSYIKQKWNSIDFFYVELKNWSLLTEREIIEMIRDSSLEDLGFTKHRFYCPWCLVANAETESSKLDAFDQVF